MLHPVRCGAVTLMLTALMAACQAPVTLLPQAPTAPPTARQAPTTMSVIGIRAPQALSDAFFAALLKGDYTAAEVDFDATMKSKLGPDALKRVWESMLSQVGAYQKPLGARTQEQPPYFAIITTLQFERAALDMRVVVDMNSGMITGLFFTPNQQPAVAQATADAAYSTPDYVDKSRFSERAVDIGAAPWLLSATLTLPVGPGPFAVVVLVHGSGPNDRDETVGLNKPFRDLAWGLASQGVAVLRYEKRTRVYAAQMAAGVATLTVKEEVIDDAVAAVAMLRRRTDIDPQRLFVLGHSLGGMLAPRIAQADPAVAGLIIMAGPTRSLQALIVEQTSYLLSLPGHGAQTDQDKVVMEETRKAAAAIDALTPDNAAANVTSLFGAPASYWLDLNQYHPAELAATLPQRMLIMQGGRDYQVTQVDLQGWKDALAKRPDVQFALFDDLNHVFATGSGKSTPDEYAQPGHVAAGVITRMAAWIQSAP